MLRKRGRVAAGILLALLVATMLFGRSPMAARAADDEATGGGSYESPVFGYEVEWTTGNWAVDEEFSASDADGDKLALRAPNSLVQVVGVYCDCVPQDIVDYMISVQEEQGLTIDVVDAVTGDDTVASLVVFETNGMAFNQYIEVRVLDEGTLVMITLTASEAAFDGQVELVVNTITFEGQAPFVTLPGSGDGESADRAENSRLDFIGSTTK